MTRLIFLVLHEKAHILVSPTIGLVSSRLRSLFAIPLIFILLLSGCSGNMQYTNDPTPRLVSTIDNSCQIFDPAPTYLGINVSWSGQCQQGLAEGNGTLTYYTYFNDSGNVDTSQPPELQITGNFLAGKAEGLENIVDNVRNTGGLTYAGSVNFKDSLMSGNGSLRSSRPGTGEFILEGQYSGIPTNSTPLPNGNCTAKILNNGIITSVLQGDCSSYYNFSYKISYYADGNIASKEYGTIARLDGEQTMIPDQLINGTKQFYDDQTGKLMATEAGTFNYINLNAYLQGDGSYQRKEGTLVRGNWKNGCLDSRLPEYGFSSCSAVSAALASDQVADTQTQQERQQQEQEAQRQEAEQQQEEQEAQQQALAQARQNLANTIVNSTASLSNQISQMHSIAPQSNASLSESDQPSAAQISADCDHYANNLAGGVNRQREDYIAAAQVETCYADHLPASDPRHEQYLEAAARNQQLANNLNSNSPTVQP